MSSGVEGAKVDDGRAEFSVAIIGGRDTATEPTIRPLLFDSSGNVRDVDVNAANRFAPNIRTTEAFQVTSSGDNTVKTPAAGKKLRVHWVGMSTPDGGIERLAIVKFGAAGAARYRWYMGSPGAFAHWETIEGAADEALIVNLSGAATVQVNVTYEEI